MNDREVDDRFNAAQMIAREAGALALQYFRRSVGLEVRIKGPQDIVSNADHDVEKLIRNRIEGLFPGDGFLGEESGSTAVDGDLPGLWVVDPIDGSACFVNSIPVWCVSIAFVVGCEIEIGVIYDPNANEMFASRHGSGAHLNGEQIRAGAQTRFDEGTVGIGYSTRTEPKPAVQAIERLLAAGGMYQRNGSGALMLAYVAAGRLLGYYEAHINAWDCLAGIVLVREAGGWTNDFLSGDGLTHGNAVAASVPGLADAMRQLTGLT